MQSTITLNCSNCAKQFEKLKTDYAKSLKRNPDYLPMCNRQCNASYQSKTSSTYVSCAFCGKENKKRKSSLIYENSFCNHSCAMSFRNKTQHGYRRSKLEVYIENQIKEEFPNLIVICNDRHVIGSELDFYFPDLHFAIELNGIIHYEPIFGKTELERLQHRDKQKFLLCHQAGIELAVIDTSSCSHLTQKAKDKFWGLIKPLLATCSVCLQTHSTSLVNEYKDH